MFIANEVHNYTYVPIEIQFSKNFCYLLFLTTQTNCNFCSNTFWDGADISHLNKWASEKCVDFILQKNCFPSFIMLVRFEDNLRGKSHLRVFFFLKKGHA